MFRLQYIYYLLMLACFIRSLFYIKFYRVRLLTLLLLISIITEIMVEICIYKKMNYYIFYHFFNICEYTFITLILYDCIPYHRVKKAMQISIPVFAAGSVLITLNLQGVLKLPSISNSIEGLLVITWCLTTMWSIEPIDERSIFQRSSFWIALAFFVYFIGTLPFNAIYNSMMAVKSMKTSARVNFSIVNSIGNYGLYILLLIGLSQYRWKKSIQPLS